MVGNWISERQLLPFLTTLAEFARYDFDDSDYLAITQQLAADGSVGRATYCIGGQIDLEFELEHGDGVISFRAHAPSEIEAQIEGATAAFQAMDR